MAVLAKEANAPSDLRAKSLRLAAHVLENDPDLRGGIGHRAHANCFESGEALKQMQKIIDAQGPSSCRTDLGTMKTDIAAPGDGTVSGIDCLRLNRLARMAGAPIDKGAGIRDFLKKIGDHVEKGDRLIAFTPSNLRNSISLSGRPKSSPGYQIERQDRPSSMAGRRDECCRPLFAGKRGGCQPAGYLPGGARPRNMGPRLLGRRVARTLAGAGRLHMQRSTGRTTSCSRCRSL